MFLLWLRDMFSTVEGAASAVIFCGLFLAGLYFDHVGKFALEGLSFACSVVALWFAGFHAWKVPHGR